MKDAATLVVLLLAFATFATSHVAIIVKLFARTEDRWRGAVALIAPPLAPLWALRRAWRAWAGAWVGSFVIYAIALIVALR